MKTRELSSEIEESTIKEKNTQMDEQNALMEEQNTLLIEQIAQIKKQNEQLLKIIETLNNMNPLMKQPEEIQLVEPMLHTESESHAKDSSDFG